MLPGPLAATEAGSRAPSSENNHAGARRSTQRQSAAACCRAHLWSSPEMEKYLTVAFSARARAILSGSCHPPAPTPVVPTSKIRRRPPPSAARRSVQMASVRFGAQEARADFRLGAVPSSLRRQGPDDAGRHVPGQVTVTSQARVPVRLSSARTSGSIPGQAAWRLRQRRRRRRTTRRVAPA